MRPRHASRARAGALPAAGVLMTLVLAGCGGGGFAGEERAQSEGGTTEVRMLVNITPNLTQTYWEGLVKTFEQANPGIDVKIEAPSGKGVADTLQQQLAAGNAPDVVETLMADETLAPQMLDLSDQPWVKDTPLAQEAALDGKIYTVGVGEQAQSLVFYNKTAFDKAGITEPPKTWDELTEAMGKLKDAGYLPLRTAGDFVTGLQLLQLSGPAKAVAHPNWYQDVKAGTLKAGESMLPYLERYKSWLDKGYLDKNALGLKYADAEASFLSGKAGMYVMGSWFTAAEADAKKDFEVGVFPAPVDEGQSYPGPQGATMAAPYMILKSTPHKDAALKLVQWLVTDKAAVASQLQQDGNFRTGVEREFTPLEREVQKILDEAPAKVAQGEGYGADTLPKGFNSAWNTEVQGLYVGKSPRDVATAVDRWLDSRS
ncbi:multiple sugar transport system substrate-binding protein/raffinose/stachyose/melibiose transport system substrate-binding protein [Thermocatellispora tengchongensis]|uniref:Multiple sugar transport system substrate-binding protein/raffinose/stachyose/melibiose transport system substrate-binding protein n=1 Tax=Thermocatellispora tengchongensis TaxID=1073253 RepID=A0A840NYK9_9ACTN|nr:extracellular solute-binding protein [Thermocatellispora tengchongensis]MBB5131296.1 multiple sugar transport system substrate-binding protein/raffinose/stachyose/melibiose transport system substrate-binding protein [Thermocatellispora tengchongensis]